MVIIGIVAVIAVVAVALIVWGVMKHRSDAAAQSDRKSVV